MRRKRERHGKETERERILRDVRHLTRDAKVVVVPFPASLDTAYRRPTRILEFKVCQRQVCIKKKRRKKKVRTARERER